MDSHDYDVSALKGLIWLAVIWWWLWGPAWFTRETTHEDVDARDESAAERPERARYSCVRTEDDHVLVGVRIDPPSAEAKSSEEHPSRTIVEAMARASATPRSWQGYFASMRIWFRLANELSPDST
jgi:hypothetical protein